MKTYTEAFAMIDPDALRLLRYIDQEIVKYRRISEQYPQFANRLSGLENIMSRAWIIFLPDVSYLDFIEIVRDENQTDFMEAQEC